MPGRGCWAEAGVPLDWGGASVAAVYCFSGRVTGMSVLVDTAVSTAEAIEEGRRGERRAWWGGSSGTAAEDSAAHWSSVTVENEMRRGKGARDGAEQGLSRAASFQRSSGGPQSAAHAEKLVELFWRAAACRRVQDPPAKARQSPPFPAVAHPASGWCQSPKSSLKLQLVARVELSTPSTPSRLHAALRQILAPAPASSCPVTHQPLLSRRHHGSRIPLPDGRP